MDFVCVCVVESVTTSLGLGKCNSQYSCPLLFMANWYQDALSCQNLRRLKAEYAHRTSAHPAATSVPSLWGDNTLYCPSKSKNVSICSVHVHFPKYILLFILFVIMCGAVHISAHTLADRKRASELLELEFLVLGSCPVWVLWTELWLSLTAASPLT